MNCSGSKLNCSLQAIAKASTAVMAASYSAEFTSVSGVGVVGSHLQAYAGTDFFTQ